MIIQCFEGTQGESPEHQYILSFISRHGSKVRYLTEEEVLTLAGRFNQVSFYYPKKTITFRPFMAGLGWVAEVKKLN